jgi:NAD(P)-dependent dehydrogenase (short-subunit alcohol dehydrogenase family)
MGAVRLRLDGFLALDDADFQWALDLNFFTTLRASRAALVPMVDQGHGAIVNIASVNAFFQPDGGTVDYGVAKAGVVNLTKSLSQEFGASGIRVNAISPGPVETDLWLGERRDRRRAGEDDLTRQRRVTAAARSSRARTRGLSIRMRRRRRPASSDSAPGKDTSVA